MNDKVFVVMGTTGEYSDRSEWPVRCYPKEDLAKTHVEEATRQAARIFNGLKTPDDEAKKWDPDMNFDYTGTTYYVMEVPFEKKLP